MYEYILARYPEVFTTADVALFVTAGWLTQAQADEMTGGAADGTKLL